MQRLTLTVVAVLAGLAMALAACGGSGGSGTSGDGAEGAKAGQPGAGGAVAGAGDAKDAGAQAETGRETGSVAVGDPDAGKALFGGTCQACHGPDAKGVPNLGRDLTTSTFVAGSSEAELVAFMKVGRGPTDPGNITGIAMPPKGGNPALDDQDLADLAAYVRSLSE